MPIRCCNRWACRLRGFMLRRRTETALLMVMPKATLATVHMLWVFFPLGIVWIAEDGVVVDKVLARPFHRHYAPQRPARYILEGPPALLEWVKIGDRVQIPTCETASSRS